jgi:gamma-glutamyltranspeptidase/glutathione hydrolase
MSASWREPMMRRTVVLWVGLACMLLAAAPPSMRGEQGMVASDHPLGSAAGAAVLAQGGNAIDAVVATALAVGVIQPSSSGLGGGGFAVVVLPDQSAHVIDFREVAPAAAHRDIYVEAESPDASRIGGLAVGVPGEPAGLITLHQRWGVLPLAVVVAPAVQLAREGFPVGHHLAKALEKLGEDGPALCRQLFDQDGVPGEGDRVSRKALAKTLTTFAKTEGKAFQDGPIAADIARGAAQAGGILTAADLAAYTPRERAPIVGEYRGWTVVTMPPPSSGGVILMQILRVLEAADVGQETPHSAAWIHRLAEAMKHAYADRARYMGDPDRVEIPIEAMLAPDRIGAIQADLDPAQTHARDHYGTPIDIGLDAGTQHISVLDRNGMAVALTTTINTAFGSRVVAPRSGILLNNEMDDFVARPGVPNAYGLVGSEANAVAPGAKPLSSMSPTVLISPDGTQRIVVGASGGPFIISSTLQAIVNVIDFGMGPSAAVSVPRMHHQWAPNTLFVDVQTSADTIRVLESLGHDVKQFPFFSSVQLVHGTADEVRGASDPRKGGAPARP